MYNKDEKAEIWLDSFGFGLPKKLRLRALVRSAHELVAGFSARYAAVEKIVGEEEAAAMRRSLEDGAAFRALLESYARKGVRCVTLSSPLYPQQLLHIPDPPLVLYCKGDVSLFKGRMFAIVGARRTLPAILQLTRQFACELSAHFTIVSGMADGGDAAALRGALEGGRPISVLACGCDRFYPAANCALQREVEAKGLLVSEYPPGTKPSAWSFPARNRIIAGLSEGVLVVSGGEKSGTRSTAESAYTYGRDVFAFPYTIGEPTGAGCNALLKEYAKLADNLVDIASAFGINLTAAEKIELTPAESAAYAAIEGEAHASAIAERAGIPAHELPALLVSLEIKKLIAPCGGNRYRRLR